MRVLRLAVVAAVACAAYGACGHDAKPVVQPDEHPPLPAATPIGYLLDDATELQLRDDQVSQLRTLDSDLAAKLDVLDAGAHTASAAPAGPRPQTASRRRGGGGGRRGGRGGGASTGGGAGSGSAARPATSAPASASAADEANRRSEQRTTDVRDALGRAFGLLDPVQRVMARRLLSDKGVDLDTGGASTRTAEPTEPAGPDEPDTDTGSGGN